MATSGRTCSTKTTEVNFPDTIENSYSQQEETKLNFGASKNRLLLSQVAYFQNYQLQTSKDRKDHDEERKYRYSKNKLLMSQVAYYLSCRLKTKVTGFLCSAPNVNMVPSGKSPSRKNTEVNIPEGNEKSCCQQEENRLNARANKKTLLRSQVVDFLNDWLKIHEEQKDHEEDQKYEDKQNKLLMSQAACDLGCRLKTEENDADEDEGVHVAEAEIIQESRAPRLIGEVPKVDVQRVPEDSLEECAITRSSSYGPTASSQPHGDTDEITFEEDNVDSALVAGSPSSHDVVEDALVILSEDGKDHEEDQKYEDKQNKLLMSQAACDLGCRLKTEENDADEDEGVHVAEAEIIQESRASRLIGEVPKVDVQRVPEDSLEECAITRSSSYGPTASSQPHGDTDEITFEEDNVDSALVAGSPSSHDVVEDALVILSEDGKDHEEDQKYEDKQNKLLMSQAACDLGCRLKTEENDADEDEGVHVAEAEIIQESRASRLIGEVPKVDVQRVPEDSLEECAITRSSSYGPTASSQPHGDTDEITFEEDHVDSALVAGSPSSHDVVEDALIILSEDGKDHEEDQKYEDKQNKLLMSQAACDLGCRLKTEENDADEDEGVHVAEAEIIQESRAPRLIGEVPKVDVQRVPEDSLEECAITRSSSYGPTASSQPHGDTDEITFEEDNVDSALVAGSPSSHDVVEDALVILSESQSDDDDEEEKGPVPHRNLQESVEEEAPQESWDEGYSTLSVPPGTSAFNEPYRSNLHSLEEQQVDLACDIDKIKISKKRKKTKTHHAPGSSWSWWKQKSLKSSGTHWIYWIPCIQPILSYFTPARLTHMLFFICRRACSLDFGHGQ
ncbi:NBPF family member NBPF1-like isoform X1 [Saimiri boliviensis]|uniref:NBPF family member NBPF1-like isoform X1 n=1 Tax=Saimiri boliviensis TaxID=27679 RepID=UPI003D77F8F4